MKLENKITLITGGKSTIGKAKVVIFLASEEASFIHGIKVFIDGGMVQF